MYQEALTLQKVYDIENPNCILDAESMLLTSLGGKLSSSDRGDLHDKRVEFARNIKYRCAFCGSPVQIYGNTKRRYHFKHLHVYSEHKPYDNCIYYSGYQADPEEIKRAKYHGQPESDIHKKLKQLIKEKLSHIGTVDEEKVIRSTIDMHRWRKPDLCLNTDDKKVAIEVQVSTTSLNTIIGRADFYSEHDMFLLWIVNELDGSFTNYDIFADSQHNLFVLDHDAICQSCGDELFLKCYHYDYFVDQFDRVQKRPNLIMEMISFDDLTFKREVKDGYPVNSVYYKSDEQLISEAYEIKRKRDEDHRRELEQRKETFLNTLNNFLTGKSSTFSSIANGYFSKNFDNMQFVNSCLLSYIENGGCNYNRLDQVLEFFIKNEWIEIYDIFPMQGNGCILLEPIIYSDHLPDDIFKSIIRYLIEDGYDFEYNISAIYDGVDNTLQNNNPNKKILARCYYIVYCYRIIQTYCEIIDSCPCINEDGRKMLKMLDSNLDLVLIVQSFLIKFSIVYNQNMAGTANAIKNTSAFKPYFHVILRAYDRTKIQLYEDDAKLLNQMEAIREIKEKEPQNISLNNLFRCLFPDEYN